MRGRGWRWTRVPGRLELNAAMARALEGSAEGGAGGGYPAGPVVLSVGFPLYCTGLATTGEVTRVETVAAGECTLAIVFPSRVTDPMCASARPCSTAPVASEIEMWARTFP